MLDSVSRIMPSVCSKEHLSRANELRRLMATYEGARLIHPHLERTRRVGTQKLDLVRPVGLMQQVFNLFLTQEPDESCDFAETVAELLQIGE